MIDHHFFADLVWLYGEDAYRIYLECGGQAAALSEVPPATLQSAKSAEMLIEHRGGDILERAEFARLFATGEPREGLRAFLEKRRPDFSGSR